MTKETWITTSAALVLAVMFFVLIGAARQLPFGDGFLEWRLGDFLTAAAFVAAYLAGLLSRAPRGKP